MDSRIGKLNSGKFYAFANGYDKPEVVGTLAEVEAALGLTPVTQPPLETETGKVRSYTVTLRFQFPAWDVVNGIPYENIYAKSKSEAIKRARAKAFDDGHTGRHMGRYTFTAEVDE